MRLQRRQFLATSAAIGVSHWLPLSQPSDVFGQETKAANSAAKVVEGKHQEMRVVGASPIVLETPLSHLAKHRITPKELLFVRNNVDMPGTNRMTPNMAPTWDIEVHELARRRDTPKPHRITLPDLTTLPMSEVEMVVQCSGNSRMLMSRAAPIEGTAWGRGGVGNVVFRGVKLSALFDKLGVNVNRRGKYLTMDGRDAPASKGSDSKVAAGQTRHIKDFEHSIPIDDALKSGLIALEMNGEPLPAIHGGPVRFVMPGYYGTVHLKWLSSLSITEDESRQESQVPRYRNPLQPIEPGRKYDYTLANSRPNWRMNVKSIVFAPEENSKVKAGGVEVIGVAFNDGEAPIESVHVSWDQGEHWQPAELEKANGQFSWTRWKTSATLTAKSHEVWVKATDTIGRTQPLDGNIFWNPGGYEWNGVEKIKFECV